MKIGMSKNMISLKSASKMINIGKLPLDLQTQAFYNVVRPDGSPDWQWRFQLKFIFPTGKN